MASVHPQISFCFKLQESQAEVSAVKSLHKPQR